MAYIQADRPPAARDFADRVEAALRRLIDFPESGRVIPEFEGLGYREVLVDSYRLFYRVRGDVIWVVGSVARRPGAGRARGAVTDSHAEEAPHRLACVVIALGAAYARVRAGDLEVQLPSDSGVPGPGHRRLPSSGADRLAGGQGLRDPVRLHQGHRRGGLPGSPVQHELA